MLFSKEPSPLILKTAQTIHEHLNSLGLSVETIEHQTLNELGKSLQVVNGLIDHPESLKLIGIKRSHKLGYYFPYSRLKISFEAFIQPILLDRKRLIANRLESLKLNAGIEGLDESIKQISDRDFQQRLSDTIQSLKVASQSLDNQLISVEKEQEPLKRQWELERLAIWETKSKILRSFLERESAATLIGIIILTAAAIAWIIHPLFGTSPIDEFKDYLFLVMGYFFGQSSARSSNLK
ncbi:MAG: hypothetical protein ACFE0I_09605 [Elainellaceae cyanobacterium]